MKPEIHPEYVDAVVTCACGSTIETRSTVAEIHVEICSNCHPFYTGRQRLMDTAGRVEKFRARYGLPSGAEEAEEPVADEPAAEAPAEEAEEATAEA